jgi:predicted methyltransferase
LAFPQLYSFFINELVQDLKNSGARGIQLSPNDIDIFSLMFADDVALLSDTVNGLQLHLNTLHQFCQKTGLRVNTQNNMAMVFKGGGILAASEHWHFVGSKLEDVQLFTYVGVSFFQLFL